MEETLVKLSRKLDIPVEEILIIYKSYWRFIKTKIEELPLKEDLSEEEFDKLRTNFNIPKIGKLHCTYSRYRTIKEINKKINNNGNKYKEDTTDC